jgi:hypothetical protein
MKKWLFPCVVALAFAMACCSKVAVNEEEAAPPQPVFDAEPAPATPAPVAVTPVATPAPVVELAPEGVFYLLAAARVETADGIHGLPPGTGVKLVRPGVYLTPYGEASLSAEQVTNDLSAARAARDADKAAQAMLRQQGAANAAVATTNAQVDAKQTATTHDAALKQIDRERAEKKLTQLNLQEGQLRAEIEGLELRLRQEYWRERKGRTVTSTTGQRLTAAKSQLYAVQAQITAASRAAR